MRVSERDGNFFAYLIIPSSYFRFGAEKVAFTPLLRLSASGMGRETREKKKKRGIRTSEGKNCLQWQRARVNLFKQIFPQSQNVYSVRSTKIELNRK